MIARTLLHHEASYRGRTYVLRPPSVGEALTIVGALPGASRGDRDDLSLIRDACRGWLPRPLHRALFPSRLRALAWTLRRLYDGTQPDGQATRLAVVGELLRLGEAARLLDEGVAKREPQKGKESEDASVSDRDWSAALATYCRAYGSDPHTLLLSDTPWPLFLELVAAAEALAARDQMRLVEARAVGRLDGEQANKDLHAAIARRAWLQSDERERNARGPQTEDEQRRVLANLKRLMGGEATPRIPNPTPADPNN